MPLPRGVDRIVACGEYTSVPWLSGSELVMLGWPWGSSTSTSCCAFNEQSAERRSCSKLAGTAITPGLLHVEDHSSQQRNSFLAKRTSSSSTVRTSPRQMTSSTALTKRSFPKADRSGCSWAAKRARASSASFSVLAITMHSPSVSKPTRPARPAICLNRTASRGSLPTFMERMMTRRAGRFTPAARVDVAQRQRRTPFR
mmetsp:Transcript_22382/g.52704  ORF Transcript_22382/g.52704 Transcript_22382/m.52704 type:complete len:200 (+) Transcript_22382:895-1494(+)